MSKLCDNCVVEHCADRNRGQVIFCSSHAAKKVQTHADQIRAMSDEELEWAIDPAIVPPGMSKREWLQQPAEA